MQSANQFAAANVEPVLTPTHTDDLNSAIQFLRESVAHHVIDALQHMWLALGETTKKT